jgi:hypothetical protein
MYGLKPVPFTGLSFPQPVKPTVIWRHLLRGTPDPEGTPVPGRGLLKQGHETASRYFIA